MSATARRTFLAATLGAAALLTGCGGDPTPATAPAPLPTVEASTPTPTPSRCQPVPAEVLAELADGEDLQLVDGHAVRSSESLDSGSPVYFLAARVVRGATGEGEAAVWARTGTVEGDGLTMSVDSLAEVLTEWPRAGSAGLGLDTDGAVEARECARAGA
jgi:hypothetical protein